MEDPRIHLDDRQHSDFMARHGYAPEFYARVQAKRAQRISNVEVAEGLRNEARKLFRSYKAPEFVADLAIKTAEEHGVSPLDVAGRCTTRKVVYARNEVIYTLKQEKPAARTLSMIGQWFNRDHTTVMYAIASHARKNGLPNLTGYNLDDANSRRLAAAHRALAKKRRASSTQSTGR